MTLSRNKKTLQCCLLLLICTTYCSHLMADESTTCTTQACKDIAVEIEKKMNLSVNPCEDFYEFACGRFVKETPIEKGKSSIHMFELAMNTLRKHLKALLETPIKNNEIKPFVQTKQLYQMCMNETAIEAMGVKSLLELLKNLGGFPVLAGNDWDDKSFSWTETNKKINKIVPANFIINVFVSSDLMNSSKRIITVDQPEFQLVREFLIKDRNDTKVKAHYEYMRDISILLGADKNKAAKEMSDVIDFQIALAQISTAKEVRRNATTTHNPMSIKALQQKFPYINWLSFIKDILPSSINIDENEVVNVVDVEYFKKLGDYLKAPPKRTIANFLLGQVSFAAVQFLSDKLRKRRIEYLSVIEGLTEAPPRWEECIDIIVTDKLPIALSAMYVRDHFPVEAKKTALEMVNFIKQEFKNILNTIDWMDDVTKNEALEKLKAMITLIAYPDELNNDEALIKYYEGLNIENNNFLKSVFNIDTFKANVMLKQLREPVIKDDWKDWADVAQVNAFYAPTRNLIIFPAGILQGHFFSAKRPQYLNYGGIGVAIGHEITHGFDDQGAQFDKNGNVRDWWNPTTKKSFKEKIECIVGQYNNTLDSETNLYLNGVLTQGENIADNGALKVTYNAYNQYTQSHGPEMLLPGLKYNQKQLLWTTIAQTYCAKFKPEILTLLIEADNHAPSKYRVLLPFQNNHDFSKDFQCPEGSPMNPTKKCSVW